jgi:hypothetical protein
MSKIRIIILSLFWAGLVYFVLMTIIGLLYPIATHFASSWIIGPNWQVGPNFQVGGSYVSTPSPAFSIAEITRHWLELLEQDSYIIPPIAGAIGLWLYLRKSRENIIR